MGYNRLRKITQPHKENWICEKPDQRTEVGLTQAGQVQGHF